MMARVTAPDVGNVSPTVASSPTLPSIGFHPLIRIEPVYLGFEAADGGLIAADLERDDGAEQRPHDRVEL
jgi:hypothetical protein